MRASRNPRKKKVTPPDQRQRINLTIESKDYSWLCSRFSDPDSLSDSSKVAQLIRAARSADLAISIAEPSASISGFASWLEGKKGKLAQGLHDLLRDYLSESAD